MACVRGEQAGDFDGYYPLAPHVRSVADWRAKGPTSTNPRYLALRERAVEGLRKAGMPES